MAIDFGTKRVGVAVTDSLRIIASGLTTVPNKEIYTFLKTYLEQETVEIIVVGHPQRSNGKASPIQNLIDKFVATIKKQHPTIQVTTFNEQFTSLRAKEAIFKSGAKKKKRRNKALVDTISAAIILQDYMEENFW